MLDGEAEKVPTPIICRRLEDELGKTPPALGQIVQGTEYAEDWIGLCVVPRVDLPIAEGAQREVCRRPQIEDTSRRLLLGSLGPPTTLTRRQPCRPT